MKKAILLTTMIIGIFGNASAQIQWYVPVGEGMLYAAIEFAQDGEELLLVPGGVYTESVEFELGTLVGKNISILVDGDGSEKAIVQLLTPATEESTPVFFEIGHEAGITLRGIEFDGSLNDQANVNCLVNFYMGEEPATTNVNTIRIDNCYIHDLMSDVIKAGNDAMADYVLVDSTIVDNSVMRNVGTSVYYKYAGANVISLKNSTFDTINSYGIRIGGPGYTFMYDNTPKVDIDYTTWYNVGTEDNREMIQVEYGPHLNPWTVTNSIFQQQVSQTRTFINIKETTGDSLATISNIGYWDIGKTDFREHTVSDTLRADAQFVDAPNGDLTLAVGSPMLYWGAGYLSIGDPRWAGNWTTSVDQTSGLLPKDMALKQNYPNPFNPSTHIPFEIAQSGPTRLTVFDLNGGLVATLVDENLMAGSYQVEYSPNDGATGMYLYRLESAGRTATQKMLYLK